MSRCSNANRRPWGPPSSTTGTPRVNAPKCWAEPCTGWCPACLRTQSCPTRGSRSWSAWEPPETSRWSGNWRSAGALDPCEVSNGAGAEREQRDRGVGDPADHQHVAVTERLTERTVGELADGHRHDRAERIVGVGAREHVVLDILLHRQVPAHAEDLDAHPCQQRHGNEREELRFPPEHHHRDAHQRAAEHADEQRTFEWD